MKLVFASNNQNKLEEIKAILPEHVQLLSLSDVNFNTEIEETGDTFEENAALKAQAVFNATGLPCFADDSGLIVEALNGQPGVKSARYAGEPPNHQANINLLLKSLEGIENRKASFKTVICYKDKTGIRFFDGEVIGQITQSAKGTSGFGYDPVFIPNGYELTFAEMTAEEKNKISHRKKATAQMLKFLGEH